jgi:PPOX class probable F420-dependent enzyme
MAGGRCADLAGLPREAQAILDEARRGVLTTIDPHGRPHAVPVCYVVRGDEIATPIDAKPKGTKDLGRRKNIARDPVATLLVDRWTEDWTGLGWVMVRGVARFEPSGDTDDLVERYPQYENVIVGSEIIVIRPDEISWWLWAEPTR